MFLLEADLDRVGGHESTLLNSVLEVIQGRTVELIGPKDSPENWGEDVDLHAILTPRSIRLADPDTAVLRDAKVVSELLGKETLGSVLIVPSSGQYVTRLIIELYCQHGFTGRTKLRAILPEHFSALSNEDLSSLRRLSDEGYLKIGTEFEETASALRNEMDLPASPDFLLPCSIQPSSYFAQRQVKKDGPVVVNLMGGMRREKGKYLLPKIVNALRKELAKDPRKTQIILKYQSIRKSKWSESNIKFALWFWWNVLPSLPHRRLVVLEPMTGVLTDEAYADAIRQADVLLMPYDKKRYAQRGSGVLTDGVLAQTPIVCTKGIGGAEFRKDGNAIEATTPAEFASAIIEVANDPGPYLSGALRARSRILARMQSLGFDDLESRAS